MMQNQRKIMCNHNRKRKHQRTHKRKYKRKRECTRERTHKHELDVNPNVNKWVGNHAKAMKDNTQTWSRT